MIKLRAILGRRLPLLIIATLLGAGAGIVSSIGAPSDVKPVYDVEQIVVANPNTQTSNIQQDSLRVTRGAVAQRAAELMGDPTALDTLAAKVDATASAETNTISISTSGENIEPSKKLVGAFAEAFLSVTNTELQREQSRQLDQLTTRANDIKQQVADFDRDHPEAVAPEAALSTDARVKGLATQRQQLVQTQAAADQAVLQQQLQTSAELPYSALGAPSVSKAKTSLLNVPTSPMIRAGLLGFVGLLLGTGLVLVIERAKQRIDTREELADAIGVPIIAEIGYLPKSKRSLHTDGRLRLDGVWAEPYRRVRAAVQFVQTNQGSTLDGGDKQTPKVFLITSAQPGEGKSTSAALTALALAEIDVPTVVIGADFRRPKVEQLLGATPGPTLQDLAEMTVDRPTADDVVRPTQQPNLYLACGGPSTREVAQLVIATKELIAECRRRGATVIIDSSPLQAANDTIDLLDVVDEVILVVRSGEATAAGLIDSVDLLRQLGAHLMGVVLVGTPGVGRMQIYYDGYYIQKPATPTPATG